MGNLTGQLIDFFTTVVLFVVVCRVVKLEAIIRKYEEVERG